MHLGLDLFQFLMVRLKVVVWYFSYFSVSAVWQVLTPLMVILVVMVVIY